MKLKNLLQNQRREKILELLREDGSAKVASLSVLSINPELVLCLK